MSTLFHIRNFSVQSLHYSEIFCFNRQYWTGKTAKLSYNIATAVTAALINDYNFREK